MFRSGLVRSLAAVLGAFLIASCSEAGPTAPAAPAQAVGALASPQSVAQDLIGDVTDATHLKLRALWWKNVHQKVVKVSKTIDRSGGTISIPETGLTLSFPAGAVTAPIRITVTSDDKYVAYKMEPSGTRFLEDVTVTQQLAATELSGVPLRSNLYAAYIADDRLNLGGIVKALEIEPSITIFSPHSPRHPEAEVWVIRHFSRYMLASG
jgi:ZU5 domain